MIHELEKLYAILVSFLGEAKSGFSEHNLELEFPCPCCIDREGNGEARKYNLAVNLQKQVFQCWKCSSMGEPMKGSIVKLIRLYGNEELLEQYKEIIRSIHESELYKLHFSDKDFNIDTSIVTKEDLKFPDSFQYFDRNKTNYRPALKYLLDRGLTWDIIEKYKIGYTLREEELENKKYSYRVIIPSFNALGELNYWVGRDYLPKSNVYIYRTKYANPKAEKKEIIFNEEKVQWDADITLVEGAFDHIVVPNSIPLLGKALDKDYKLYWDLITKANAKVNIFLDNDTPETAKYIYGLLNHGRLYDKIRIINADLGKDPSEIYEKYGTKGIIKCLQETKKISECELFF